MRAGRAADRAVSTGTLVLASLPEFVVAGLLLTVLAGWLGWLPAVSLVPLRSTPLAAPQVLVLPVLSLLLVALAPVTRMLRASVADVAASAYVEAARLRGVRGPRLVLRHVLPAAAAPATQALVLGASSLIGGAVVVESVFGYPGIGSELVTAVGNRDLPLVQGIALTLCAIAVLLVLLGDLVVRALTPHASEVR
jgi:peptide/nickel transport system permease protein